MKNTSVAAIVLAAGKGTRMKIPDSNKVVLPIGNKPMIVHGVEALVKLNLGAIIVVVGFAKESVQNALKEMPVVYAVQEEQLGTAHALECGLAKVPSHIEHILVVQGDDSALYTPELLSSLLEKHAQSEATMTLLTIQMENPAGLGRVVRDTRGNLIKIVEEKDATEEEREITEVNPACYIFSIDFLRRYIQKITKSSVTGEYYLTSLIDVALQHGEKIATLEGDNLSWRGVNTPEELAEANRLLSQQKG